MARAFNGAGGEVLDNLSVIITALGKGMRRDGCLATKAAPLYIQFSGLSAAGAAKSLSFPPKRKEIPLGARIFVAAGFFESLGALTFLEKLKRRKVGRVPAAECVLAAFLCGKPKLKKQYPLIGLKYFSSCSSSNTQWYCCACG